MILRLFCLSLMVIAIAGCSATKDAPKYELIDGEYHYRQPGEKFRPIFAYVDGDSVSLFVDEEGTKPIVPQVLRDEIFLRRSLDVDILTMPFKGRGGQANLPRQLTADFNGNIFLGYRFDRFRFIHKRSPVGWRRFYKHRALSAGAFGGLGTAAITPWTTNYRINEEYTGFVLSHGVAVMAGVSNLTVGVGLGWDHLTDRDRDIWIYQHKPWYGVTIGLNLN